MPTPQGQPVFHCLVGRSFASISPHLCPMSLFGRDHSYAPQCPHVLPLVAGTHLVLHKVSFFSCLNLQNGISKVFPVSDLQLLTGSRALVCVCVSV